jgi:hypothetical protein
MKQIDRIRSEMAAISKETTVAPQAPGILIPRDEEEDESPTRFKRHHNTAKPIAFVLLTLGQFFFLKIADLMPCAPKQ